MQCYSLCLLLEYQNSTCVIRAAMRLFRNFYWKGDSINFLLLFPTAQSAHKMLDIMHKALTVLSKGSSYPWSQFTFKATLFRKDLMLGKDWGQEKKGATEDEMVRWHHWLSGHKLAKAQGDNERQGSLVFMESQRVGHSNWTTTLFIFKTALKWSSKRYLAFFKVECFLNWKRDW